MEYNEISCPACDSLIEGEKFIAPRKKHIPWYQFEKTVYKCPHCGALLAYDTPSKWLLILIALVMLAVYLAAILNPELLLFMPLSSLLGLFIFYKNRKLVMSVGEDKRHVGLSDDRSEKY